MPATLLRAIVLVALTAALLAGCAGYYLQAAAGQG